MGHKSKKRCFEDVKGQVFDKLTIIREHDRVKNQFTVVCVCACGKNRVVAYCKLLSGLTRTCASVGCKIFKNRIDNITLYRVWDSMKQRCTNPNHERFCDYGGRGVKVCDEWLNSYSLFSEWAYSSGYKKGLQLDKDIKGNGMLYSPYTCLWVTATENNRHTRSVKLNESKVRDILNSNLSRKELSLIYKVSDRTIGSIKRKEIWKDV